MYQINSRSLNSLSALGYGGYKSLITISAFFMIITFIYLIPWGNYVWDGLTRVFGIASFGLAALVFVVHGTHRNYSFFHFFLMLLGSWFLLSLVWTPDFINGKQNASTLIQSLFLSVVITLLVDSKTKIKLAYQAYVFGACTGSSIVISNWLNGIESKYYQRYNIPNFEPDNVGVLFAVAVPIAAYLAINNKNRILKLINTAAMPFLFFGIFLNATRTASIVALFGIIYWLFMHRNASLKIKLFIATFFISSIVAVFSFAPEASTARLFSSAQSISSGTLNGRTIIWREAIDLWGKSPFLGSGIGSLGYDFNAVNIIYNNAHNTYLNVLAEGGIIGLGLYLLMLGSILNYIMRVPLNDRIFLLALLGTTLVSQLTLNTLYDKEMWFAYSMLVIHARYLQRKTNQ